MPAVHTIGLRARRPDGAAPSGQTTTVAWRGESTMQASASGLANNDLGYTAGMFDFRADNDGLVTTANGAVSQLASAQGFGGTFVQAAAANQPVHAAANDWVAFTAASSTDANGDFLANTTIRDRYRTTANALGVFYMLFRVAAIPTWNSVLLRVGAASSTYTNFLLRSYALRMMTTGELWLGRGGNITGENRVATMATPFLADEWIAAAFVLNDSRSAGVTNGASDLVSRLFAKTKPGGSHPTLSTAVTVAQNVPVDASTVCEIGRARYNASTADSYANGFRLHSLGFDAEPPVTDAAIELVLNRLLARV
jgi:hypothetical protein